MATLFTGIELGPPIEVFALSKAFQDDPQSTKVNLTIGGKKFSSVLLFMKNTYFCVSLKLDICHSISSFFIFINLFSLKLKKRKNREKE